MRARLPAIGLAAAACLVLAGAGSARGQDAESARSKAIVLDFYKLALFDMKPADAFARYAAPDFVEHSQDSAGGDAKATVVFLRQLIARSARPRWDIIRSAAEGDMVFLHVRYTAAPGAPEYAVAEVFRVKDGRIAEHWDVTSPPPDKVINPNSRF
jgi:predicted SnoaL-like aldol condensation-catalyzing enzyme